MTFTQSSSQQETLLGLTKITRILLYIGFATLGLMIGYFFSWIIEWASGFSWVPYLGPLEFINKIIERIQSFSGPWSSIILALLGAVGGLYLTYIGIKESLTMLITDQRLKIQQHGLVTTILFEEIQHVFLDRNELVILGVSGYELVREKYDNADWKVEETFKIHNYPLEKKWGSIWRSVSALGIGFTRPFCLCQCFTEST